MTRNNENVWFNFLKQVSNDRRLNVWHLALLSGLVQIALGQNETTIVHVSRSRLMAVSHINNLMTYHKYFKQIQDMGYVKYRPSYHPGYRSTVEFLTLTFLQ